MAVKIIGRDIIPHYYICETSNGDKITLHENIINNNYFKAVKADTRVVNLANMDIGNWHIYYYVGDRKWLCQCSCGRYCAVTGYNLSYKKSLSCGHERYEDLTDKVFGEWHVLEYAGTEHGMTKWLCECSCGNVKEIYANRLKSGRTNSCGHSTNQIKDLENQHFGEWEVLNYVGNHKWRCRCSCGIEKNIYGYSLRRGDSKSCGHLSAETRKVSMIERYGDIVPNKNREEWQIDVISSKDKLLDYIQKIEHKPTAEELSKKLGINTTNVYRNIHKFGLDNYIIINYNSSKYEKELVSIIKTFTSCSIKERDRDTIQGVELDIYIPEKKIAIEFNGDYWHSDLFKDKYYHQKKTIACIEKGIHLIHIFEHEWLDNNTKKKIIKLLKIKLDESIKCIGARETIVRNINKESEKLFCNKYHLQGYTPSDIAIGCYKDSELLGIMTFGKSRFNSNFQYELIRMCWRDDVKVHGGVSKIFKYFISKYKPTSIISYCDISKFSGVSYSKIGFCTSKNKLSEPGYIWYEPNTKNIKSRYQTQKHKLLKNKLGSNDETEDDIMSRLGYIKIYNSGNLVFEWRATDGSKSTSNVE